MSMFILTQEILKSFIMAKVRGAERTFIYMISPIQIIAAIFCFFMLYNVFINYKKKNIGKYDFLFWTMIWGCVLFAGLFPEVFYMGSFFESLVIIRALDLFVIVAFLIAFALLFYFQKIIRKIGDNQTEIVKNISLKKSK